MPHKNQPWWKKAGGAFQKIFFTRVNFTLISPLSSEEVRRRLGERVRPPAWMAQWKLGEEDFVGNVEPDRFWIQGSPIGRNITPKFSGKLHAGDRNSEVRVELIPHPVAAIFQIMGALLFLTFLLSSIWFLGLWLLGRESGEGLVTTLAAFGIFSLFLLVILLCNWVVRNHASQVKLKLEKLLEVGSDAAPAP